LPLNLLLDEPAKLLEEVSCRAHAAHTVSGPRSHSASATTGRWPLLPGPWSARLLMAKVCRPACLSPAVTTDTDL